MEAEESGELALFAADVNVVACEVEFGGEISFPGFEVVNELEEDGMGLPW